MSELSDYVVMPASHWVGILSATRQKTGKTDPIASGQLPMEILGIESTPAKVEPKYANFYDYDGTLLYSYTREEAMALTSDTMPEGPSHDGLTFQGWNHYNINGSNEYTDGVDVGAFYMTDDATTRIYIDITSKDALNMPLRLFIATADTYSIDWGDGSNPETIGTTGNVSYTHTYPGTGKYVITLSAGSSPGSVLGIGLGNGGNMFTVLNSANKNKSVYSSYVYKVELGANVGGINDYAFSGCTCLETITISPTVTYIGSNAFAGCYSLRHVNIPGSVVEIKDYAFYGSGLETISINLGCAKISEGAFYNCSSLTGITFPQAMFGRGQYSGGVYSWVNRQYPLYQGTSNSSTVSVTTTGSVDSSMCMSCSALKRVSFPMVKNEYTLVDRIGSSAFYGCSSLIFVDLPDTITQIGAQSFSACNSMPALYIPKSVTTLGTPLFVSGNSLTVVDFSEHESIPSFAYERGNWSNTSDLEIRVPAALYDEWIAADGWKFLSDCIVAV